MRDLADELLQAKVKARLFGGDHAPRLGRLVILDKLGAGAMGTVYAAYDPKLDRKVAVKVMHGAEPSANARVLREARSLARLAHPNIVTIHDAGEDDGVVYVVMELATGVPLRAWLATAGVAGAHSDTQQRAERTWRDVARVMAEVAEGLAAAHRAGLIHRDVKPENILVGERARLVDFGLAVEPSKLEITDRDGIMAKLDALGATDPASLHDGGAGTPQYMAPELLAGGTATPASDQFSFAVTLFEALHGERSHAGTTRAELHEAALHAAEPKRKKSTRPSLPLDGKTIDERSESSRKKTALSAAAPVARTGRALGQFPAWLDAVVRRGLAAKPEDRFPSMDALHAELVRDRTRRRRAVVIAGLALVAGTGLGVVAFRGSGRAEPIEISCDGKARIDAVWNAHARGKVRAELGDATWASATLDGLARNAAGWERSFRAVCEATRVRGEQSDRLLELRMRCLDRALARFDAFVDALQAPLDPSGKVEAANAIGQLPDAATCETITDDPTFELPADPKVRAEAAAIEAELDRAWSSYAIGRYTAASTQEIALAERVSKLDVPALQASVLLLGGAIEARIGEGSRARKLLELAAIHAARARATELELAVWTRLLRQELFSGRGDRVIEFGAIGEATAIRAGHEGAEVLGLIGEALRNANKLDAAKEQLTKALASRDPLREDQRAIIEMNLGAVELALGRSDLAHPIHERALERSRKALGDGHPSLALHYDKLAEVARARGRLRDALELHDNSRDLRRAVYGDEDRSYATALFHRAETLLEAGRLTDAIKDATIARQIRIKTFGKDSSRLSEIEALLGEIELAAGRITEARRFYDRASALEPERRGIARTLATLRALGPQQAAVSPLDRTRLFPAVDALGLVRSSLQQWWLVEDASQLNPFSVERASMAAAQMSLMNPEYAKPLVAPYLARYQKALPVDAAVSLVVGDAMLVAGDRSAADAAYTAALAALADEPSRERLHAFRGRALARTGEPAKAAAAAANVLAAAMPELAR